jgi:photosystem II stability/assembly factor-like uncharacterized protein
MADQTTKSRARRARTRGRTTGSGRIGISRLVLIIGFLLVLVAIVAIGISLRRGGSETGGAIATLRTGDFHALAFSHSNPNTVFFGHHNGIMRSDDGGRTWTSLVDRRNFDAMSLAVSRANGEPIYLAGHDVFQISTDGGKTWQPVEHNLPGTDIHGFTMSPDDSNRLYALVAGQGGFQSNDGGRTWQQLGSLPGDVMALAVAGGGSETIYAGSMSAGVLRSADGGRSWAPATNGLGARGVYALAIDPSARQTIYAGSDGGLYKSADGGATWSKLPFPGDNIVALTISSAQPNVILAITVRDRQGLVYRSEDGGQSWG